MIVDLNLQGKKIIIIGGGNEALKRIRAIHEKCSIIIISDKVKPEIQELVNHDIILVQKKINKIDLLKYEPDLIITTTNQSKLNQEIIQYAKKNKIIVYSSDDPESSDYANLAVINVKDMIQIAISTKGKSPIMAKKLTAQIKKEIDKIITQEDINSIKIQEIARRLAKDHIHSQSNRRKFLAKITNDIEIKQLIKDKMLKEAEGKLVEMLRGMK